MRIALSLARRGLGQVWPNPAVGCVLVGNGRVVGRGWTQPGGRPHAETEALRRAGDDARGSTAYVTLEPCAHHGRTPPCAQALIDAGIARAVIALRDPDPRVDGGGIAMMEEAGVDVELGLLSAEAEALNIGFLRRIRDSRPTITLKTATTADARIATQSGASQWITGEDSRAAGHLLRATHDAILVGSGTAIHDNPSLTCRLPGMLDRSPVRIVLDGRMRLPLTHRLVTSAREIPTWMVALPPRSPDQAERRDAYAAAGIELLEVDMDDNGNPHLGQALAKISGRGITRVLIEGGGQVAAAFLREHMVDEIVWFRAPCIIGGDGVSAIAGYGVDQLSDAVKMDRVDVRKIGNDLVERYLIQG
ncbi:MAG: bifunctional diaminohydroxyphosphoribosylaminopyrimidine deaminase/5-amino-6-(5-phosphoribosylamino)uracil reductase RibD [Rhodospirillaceae bacterium]|nr:bifunctional diaminohydroxyphosphoribosylaminopyrimidine deaminase/5-amino-6-(5-phosphoribosylamino)uracil reductase RibD [Rhodospirillaceae bacterium]MBT5459256.1 bifunctional diaminohydroxyphosphoribosylaminopyrimidine deaminase/5-amino-6-(5-phosphoribosylamino)uracil reductase RibD [Rhodospirillaceae bacterium]